MLKRALNRLKEELAYPYYCHKNRKLMKQLPTVTVLGFDETLDKILSHQVSVSRFGDGEYQWMAGLSHVSFQAPDEALAARLREIAISNQPGHIVCMAPVFSGLQDFGRDARHFWEKFMSLHRQRWTELLDPDKIYYDTNITRPYMDMKDKSRCGYYFDRLRQIWDGQALLIVEGEKTRMGVGNDLFDNASGIARVLAPPTNAFSCYEEILQAAKEYGKGRLVLIALGPTATVLAYDLCRMGIRALDVGHVDVEYEWMRMGAKRKVPVARKAVYEAGQSAGDVHESDDSAYLGQILYTIKQRPL